MPKSSTNLTLKLVSTFLLIALLGAIWWFAKAQTTPNVTHISGTNQALPTVECDFKQQLCRSSNASSQVDLSIDSQQIKSFIALPFKLKIDGLNPDTVSIDFQGIEMFMGANLLQLEKQADNSFTGTITLAGHAGHHMTWRAVVKMTEAANSQEVHFVFKLM
ncbi:MAG: hypothetical protein OFPI_15630 [Osedax symbiont Rs2]|nr:MAG: hypothetical protein OFPI_15630 [Osedax symbiont Rs2]